MVDRRILIGVGILILVALSVMFFSSITGNVITGSSVMEEKIENEYFIIDDVSGHEDIKLNEVSLNDTQNISGSR